jgi:hypothetical protein
MILWKSIWRRREVFRNSNAGVVSYILQSSVAMFCHPERSGLSSLCEDNLRSRKPALRFAQGNFAQDDRFSVTVLR